MKTGLERLDMFTDNISSYKSTPVVVGYEQDLFGFNDLKWERRIQPIKYEEAKKKTEEELHSLDEEIFACQKNLQGLSGDIERDLMKKYEIIKKRKNGLAVVAVLKGVCSGCHLNIPPQMYNELLKSDHILSCPNCNRIIYWDEKNANGT